MTWKTCCSNRFGTENWGRWPSINQSTPTSSASINTLGHSNWLAKTSTAFTVRGRGCISCNAQRLSTDILESDWLYCLCDVITTWHELEITWSSDHMNDDHMILWSHEHKYLNSSNSSVELVSYSPTIIKFNTWGVHVIQLIKEVKLVINHVSKYL